VRKYLPKGTGRRGRGRDQAWSTFVRNHARAIVACEFICFLNQIDQQTPSDLAIHLILDNYGTHKHARVQRWLQKDPRFRFHFIPTSSSWLNVVERFFRDLTRLSPQEHGLAGRRPDESPPGRIVTPSGLGLERSAVAVQCGRTASCWHASSGTATASSTISIRFLLADDGNRFSAGERGPQCPRPESAGVPGIDRQLDRRQLLERELSQRSSGRFVGVERSSRNGLREAADERVRVEVEAEMHRLGAGVREPVEPDDVAVEILPRELTTVLVAALGAGVREPVEPDDVAVEILPRELTTVLVAVLRRALGVEI